MWQSGAALLDENGLLSVRKPGGRRCCGHYPPLPQLGVATLTQTAMRALTSGGYCGIGRFSNRLVSLSFPLGAGETGSSLDLIE